MGPELDLCDDCGGEGPPTCEEIWACLSTYVWVPRAAIRDLLEAHELLDQDRAAVWAVTVAEAFAGTLIQTQPLADLYAAVKRDIGLQSAVAGAAQLGAAPFEIIQLIDTW